MSTELTPKQQINELVRNANSILLLTHAHPDGDAMGSVLALKMGLEKLGKQVTAAIDGNIPEVLNFLPQFASVQKELSFQKDLLIILDENQAKVGNITLRRVSDTKLMVVVSPKDGVLTASDVRIEEGSFNTDLVIVLDCTDLDRIGNFYQQNSDLFYEVPVVNIDHHSTNVNFGKVNIVDVTASSTAEILVSLLETLGKDTPGLIDPQIATCLLTGIITDTNSFQNSNTTPKSLTVAAQMVAAGAEQQEIIRRIYMTRSLSQLRLWGRALAYIKEDTQYHFAWTNLSKADFVAAQAPMSDGPQGVIDDLLKTAEGMDFVVLLYERDGGVKGSFRSINPTVNVATLAALFNGGGHPQAAAFSIENATVAQKEQEILGKIRAHLSGKSFTLPQDTELHEEPAAQQQIEMPIQQIEPREPRRQERQPAQPSQQRRPQDRPPREPNRQRTAEQGQSLPPLTEA